MKGVLRKVGPRSREALIEAMDEALDAITSRDAKSFFEHCEAAHRVNYYDRRCSAGSIPVWYIGIGFEQDASVEQLGRISLAAIEKLFDLVALLLRGEVDEVSLVHEVNLRGLDTNEGTCSRSTAQPTYDRGPALGANSWTRFPHAILFEPSDWGLTTLRVGAFYANMRHMKPHEELIATIVCSTLGRLC